MVESDGSGRTPHGVRGLKFSGVEPPDPPDPRRTPHGVRGLKLEDVKDTLDAGGRTPHGVRGLKLRRTNEVRGREGVAPHTGCVD